MKKLFGLLVAILAVVTLASCGGHKHEYVKVDAKAATCEDGGNKEYFKCSGCDLLFSDQNGTETTLKDVTLDPLGHDWGEFVVTTQPTCTEKGVETATCKNDASHKKTQEVAALGHNFGEWTTTLQPTCTEKGSKEQVCANDASHKNVEEIPALGHTMNHVDAKEATLDEAGNKEYWQCSVCNKYFKDALGTEEYAENEWIIPVHDHQFVKTDAVAPDCLNGGNNEYYTCSICEKVFVKNGDEYELTTVEDQTLAALGHELTHHDLVDADCDSTDGVKAYDECSRCNKLFIGEQEVSAEDLVIKAGHVYAAVKAVAPTCSETGKLAHFVCSRCEKLFTTNKLDDNGDFVLDAKGAFVPNTDESGNPIYSEVAAEKLVVAIDPSAHTLKEQGVDEEGNPAVDKDGKPIYVSSIHEKVPATCHDTGLDGYATCLDCGKIFKLTLDGDGYTVVDYGFDDKGDYYENLFENAEQLVLPIDENNHVLIEEPGTAPTFEEDGVRTYYYCQYHNDLWFSDEFGENEIQDHVADIVAPKLVVDNELLDDAISYALFWYAQDFSRVELEKDNFDADLYKQLEDTYANGKTSISEATSIKGVNDARKAARQALLDLIPAANGVFDYSGLSTEERTELTGIIERYVANTGLTGITLYESASIVLYNERVQLGTENYIPNYGFGVLAEGDITADLESEQNDAWKRYYHTYETSDPATANYWNDKGAQVGDLFGYMAGSLFETFMSPEKDSYIWVGSLSKDDRPLGKVVDEEGNVSWDSDVTGKTWRVRINTGADGLKFTTNSKLDSRAAFNNRLVAAEDYLTPYRVMLTQSNGLYRGSEAAQSSSVKIEGILEYFNATEKYVAGEGQNPLYDVEAWNKYVKPNLNVYEEDGEWYFEWTNNQETNSFYAMYYIASSLFTPVPEDFINLVTLGNMWGYNKDMNESPVDNSLALGAYALEEWIPDQAIVWKKNPNYIFAGSKYKIQGIYEMILKALATDQDAAIKEFLNGSIDAASLTKNYMDEYKNDSRAHKAQAGSNFKLNANTASKATWEYYFGKNGTVAKTDEKDYWDLKPCMSNINFYKGISYSLNRNVFADKYAAIPEISYLGSAYQADAERGLSYNMTKTHEEAIAPFLQDTDHGYSLELARNYFKIALAELEEEGAYIRGTKENPTIITIEIAWMYPYQKDTYHADVKQMLEAAFNDDSVSGGCYQLNVEFWAGAAWSDVYYNKLMLGQFDLGFGSISGNAYNILDYMTVLSADQTLSGGFTLNWGPKTDDPDNQDLLLYNGMKWSFDALISAANAKTIVSNGVIKPAVEIEQSKVVKEDGSWDVTFEFTLNTEEEFSFLDLVPFGYPDGVNYDEESAILKDASNLTVAKNDNVVTVTVNVSKALIDKYFGSYKEGILYLDIYYSYGEYTPAQSGVPCYGGSFTLTA